MFKQYGAMAQQSLVFLLSVSVLFQATWGFLPSKSPDDVRIIGGDVISIQAAPFMAALYLDSRQWCGAAVIDYQFVLTAAHCLAKRTELQPSGNWRVLVGADHLNSDGFFINVEKILCHEKFDIHSDEGKHDICLLKLTEQIPFGCLWTVGMLSLPTDDRDIVGRTMLRVTGWGHTEDAKVSNELRQAEVPWVGNDCCRRIHPNVTDDMICAGSKGHNFCLQDGGSPLTYNGMVVGVASWDAEDCATYPGVYTRVSSYLTWITDTIAKN